jgi:hypothetical protein
MTLREAAQYMDAWSAMTEPKQKRFVVMKKEAAPSPGARKEK